MSAENTKTKRYKSFLASYELGQDKKVFFILIPSRKVIKQTHSIQWPTNFTVTTHLVLPIYLLTSVVISFRICTIYYYL